MTTPQISRFGELLACAMAAAKIAGVIIVSTPRLESRQMAVQH
jgi:hypothetical protein